VPRPIKRSLSLPRVAAIVAAVSRPVGGQRFTTSAPRRRPVRTIRSPSSSRISRNRDERPAFNRTLEPTLRRALEGAGFITAYDRNGLRGTVTGRSVALPEKA
jgi:hypothetical protein